MNSAATTDRVLVTGGAGFIGSHLVRALVERGHTVHVIDDLSSGFEQNLDGVFGQIKFFKGSILDEELLRAAIEGCRCVFHLAAFVSVPGSIADPIVSHRVNSEGSLRVFLACRDVGARVVFSSSSAVYGDGPELPKKETTPLEPASPYAVQKLDGELYLQMLHRLVGLEGFALRYFNVFGPGQRPDSDYAAVIPKFIERALSGNVAHIHGDGKQTRDFVFVSDVVQANLRAMEAVNADGTPINIGSGSVTELTQLASMVFIAAGLPESIEYGPERPGDIRHSSCSIKEAKRLLDFEAKVSLAEGLLQTVEAANIPPSSS